MAHFSQIRLLIANSAMNDIIHNHPWLPRCVYSYVVAVKSCDATKSNQNSNRVKENALPWRGLTLGQIFNMIS